MVKGMSIAKVVQELKGQGHNVNVYIRPDGGRRIVEIDGIRFPSSNNEGNDYARQLVGASLSRKQYEQRRKAAESAAVGKQRTKMPRAATSIRKGKPKKKQMAEKRKRKQSLTIRKSDSPEEVRMKKRIKKLMRKMRKSGKTISTDKIRQKLDREGLEATSRALANKMRKDSGLAYVRQVESLEDYIAMLKGNYSNVSSWMSLADTLIGLLESYKYCLSDVILSQNETYGWYPLLYEIEKLLREGNETKSYDGEYLPSFTSRLQYAVSEGERICNEYGIDPYMD